MSDMKEWLKQHGTVMQEAARKAILAAIIARPSYPLEFSSSQISQQSAGELCLAPWPPQHSTAHSIRKHRGPSPAHTDCSVTLNAALCCVNR